MAMPTELNFITFNEAESIVALALKKGLTPYLKGSPSSGKTAIGHKVAKTYGLIPVVFSLMDHDPTDLSGLPDLSGDKAEFKPFDTFPIEGDPVPEGKNGWLIMLDEFASGTAAMQAAANKLLYERLVGNKKLHSKAFVMAMGNLATDNAYVIEEPAHTKSRALQLFVRQDIKEWTEWAHRAGVDTRVIAFAEMKPLTITKYDPDHVGCNYACARTMEMTSDLIKGETITKAIQPGIFGLLGEGVGTEFYTFCMLRNELPTYEEVLANPEGERLPTDASRRYAMACMLADYLSVDNADTLLKYILRLPTDTQYFLMRNAALRNTKLVAHPAIRAWATPIAAKYMRT